MEKGDMVWGSSDIRWSKENKKWTVRGAEPLIGTPPVTFYPIHNHEAYRCPDCKIVVFSYGKEK